MGPEHFTSPKAHEQAERIVAYAAFPGFGTLISLWGSVVLVSGTAEIDVDAAARAIAEHYVECRRSLVALPPRVVPALPIGAVVRAVPVVRRYLLCSVVGFEVAAAEVDARLLRAAELLARMLPRESDAGAEGPSGAPALLGIAIDVRVTTRTGGPG